MNDLVLEHRVRREMDFYCNLLIGRVVVGEEVGNTLDYWDLFGRYEGFKGTVLDDFRPEISNPVVRSPTISLVLSTISLVLSLNLFLAC